MTGKGNRTTKSPVKKSEVTTDIEEMFERKLKKQEASIIEILTVNT